MVHNVALSDVFPSGAILKRVYGRKYHLWLWHFAYNGGKPIHLLSLNSEGALDLANSYWSQLLLEGHLPTSIKDCRDKVYERLWVNLSHQERSKDDGELPEEIPNLPQ